METPCKPNTPTRPREHEKTLGPFTVPDTKVRTLLEDRYRRETRRVHTGPVSLRQDGELALDTVSVKDEPPSIRTTTVDKTSTECTD